MLLCQGHTSPKPVSCRLDVNLQFCLSGRSLVHTVVHSVPALNALRCRGISQLFGMPPYSDPGCVLFIIDVLTLKHQTWAIMIDVAGSCEEFQVPAARTAHRCGHRLLTDEVKMRKNLVKGASPCTNRSVMRQSWHYRPTAVQQELKQAPRLHGPRQDVARQTLAAPPERSRDPLRQAA